MEQVISNDNFVALTNITFFVYFAYTLFQIIEHSGHMSYNARHHMYSHFYIGVYGLISFNTLIYKGWFAPTYFVILYVIAHVIKENQRLVKSNRWIYDDEVMQDV